MKTILILFSTIFLIFLCHLPVFAEEIEGKLLYEKLCSRCHPHGGNMMNPDKPLFRKHLEANGIKTADDIINVMRNPGKGMRKFTEEKLNNEDAGKIAKYILETFK